MPLIAQTKKKVSNDSKRKRTSIGRKARGGNKKNHRKAYRGQGWPR